MKFAVYMHYTPNSIDQIKQRISSKKAKDRWLRSVETRGKEIRILLAGSSFPHAETHDCETTELFVRTQDGSITVSVYDRDLNAFTIIKGRRTPIILVQNSFLSYNVTLPTYPNCSTRGRDLRDCHMEVYLELPDWSRGLHSSAVFQGFGVAALAHTSNKSTSPRKFPICQHTASIFAASACALTSLNNSPDSTLIATTPKSMASY
jgi:hypothetical protein